MPERGTNSVLVIALAGINVATRARKASRELVNTHQVRYLALQSSGRSGQTDIAGTFDSGGVRVHHVAVRERHSGGRLLDKLHNAILCYLPAFVRLAWISFRTPADAIYVTNPVLAPMALAHRLRFRSRILLDVAERPGILSAPESLASVVSKLEPAAIRALAKPESIATVAVPDDAQYMLDAGFEHVHAVRNVPLESWRAPYVDPSTSDELQCVVIGSIFAGRGYEILIEALALAIAAGTRLKLRVYGPGSAEYLSTLHALADSRGVGEAIVWEGAIRGDQVSAAYLTAHVGVVLYEQGDPGNDGLSNKILECVSTGRPVLAGDLPQNRRFVHENAVGWLTDVEPQAIADALAAVATSDGIVALSRHCRGIGDASLTWESEFSAVLRVLGN